MPLANPCYQGLKTVKGIKVVACKKKTDPRQDNELLKKRRSCHEVYDNGKCKRFMSLNPIKEPPQPGKKWEVNPDLGYEVKNSYRDLDTGEIIKERGPKVVKGWIKNLQEFNRANMKESGVWVIPRKYKEGSTEENPLYTAIYKGDWQGKFDVRINDISQQPQPQPPPPQRPQRIVTVGGTVTNTGVVGGKQYVDTAPTYSTIVPHMTDEQINDWYQDYKKKNPGGWPKTATMTMKRNYRREFEKEQKATAKKKSAPKTPIQKIPKKKTKK